jgi:hypothetical protein
MRTAVHLKKRRPKEKRKQREREMRDGEEAQGSWRRRPALSLSPRTLWTVCR